MSNSLKPWTRAAFELIVHAERHLRDGGDFDRRMAHIGFDNAIEVAISTYLGLNPIQRNGKTYRREDVEKWSANYHAKLQFFEREAQESNWRLKVPIDEVVFYHDIRNGQYHRGGPGVPEAEHLTALRMAALDVFSMLFGVNDVEQVLEDWLQQRAAAKEGRIVQNETVDKLLDMSDEPVVIVGQPYAISEALYATDPWAYQAIASSVMESRNVISELSGKYPGYVRPNIVHIGFVHYENSVYLKSVTRDGEISLTDTEFIRGEKMDGEVFSLSKSPDHNADLLVTEFDPFSIINCFELFTEQAAAAIAKAHQSGNSESPFSPTHGIRQATA